MKATKEMFVVLKNGRKVRDAKFANYEKARQFVRKQIRKSDSWLTAVIGRGLTPDYSNPTINHFGYEIKRVND